MTKKEAMRQTAQENALLSLGFTREEAESLRRISMTLHRWHEKECGSDSRCLVRGVIDADTGTFEYRDDGDAYWEVGGISGRNRYQRTPDRERGARRRLDRIMARVNAERRETFGTPRPRGGPAPLEPLGCYVQTDPRGAALYIIRPGDVLPGESVESCYTRGVCIY